MSYQNAEILRDRNGNPIPQYFDVTEGIFKPLSKDSYPDTQDVNVVNPVESVEVSNLPVKQMVEVDNQIVLPNDYPDSAVKAELELIKLRQEAIDNKLDSIIESGAVNTRLTGSNIEILDSVSGLFVGAGSRVDIFGGDKDVSDSSFLAVAVQKQPVGSPDSEVTLSVSHLTTPYTMTKEFIFINGGKKLSNYRGITDVLQVYSPSLSFYIRNGDTVDAEFSVEIYKIKR